MADLAAEITFNRGHPWLVIFGLTSVVYDSPWWPNPRHALAQIWADQAVKMTGIDRQEIDAAAQTFWDKNQARYER